MERKETIQKLRFLPKEELKELVLEAYSSDDEKLKRAIKKVAKRDVRRPKSFILKQCDSEKCIRLLSEFEDLPEKYIQTIDELFKEYKYGRNPHLFFSQFSSPSWKGLDEIKKTLYRAIEEKTAALSSELEDKYVKFKIIDISEIKNVIEILLEYQRRIDYIEPETANPAFVYTLEEGVIWISKDRNALIVNSSNHTFNAFVCELLQEYFSCRIKTFSLHKNIINAVVGKDTLRSGNYYKPRAGPDEIEGKSIRDKQLMTKTEGRETDERYDRKSSFHRVPGMTDSETGLNVDSQHGKISIRAHLKKSELRTWALDIIQKIIDEMTHVKDSDIETYLKGIELSSVQTLKEIDNSSKEIVRDIIIGINKSKAVGKTDFSTKYSINNLYDNAKMFLDFIFVPICNSCSSSNILCGKSNKDGGASLKGIGATIVCSSCGEEIVDSAHFVCACTKPLEGKLEEKFIALLTTASTNLINSTIDELTLRYKLDSNELLEFSNGVFKIIRTDYKFLYSFDELPAFKNIPKLSDIPQDVASAQYKNISMLLGEKCENYSDSNCRECLMNKKGNCLQRVIASFTDGSLHAHSPVEFGDVSFRQYLDGSSYNIVCLAKRYAEAPKIKNDRKYTAKNDGGLLRQVVETIWDSRIDFLGVVSGADIDPRLKESLIGIVKLKRKKIVFFEKNDLTRILSKYSW